MNLIGGLTSTATRAAGEENIIEFQRDLETKEMEELYHLIEKARKQLYVVEKEKGQNRKENEHRTIGSRVPSTRCRVP